MKATIIDVAKEAGVSFKTVSRVMNGETSVRPATKEKVLAAAQKLNFTVNSAARRLRSKQPHVVTLILHNVSRSYAQDAQIGAMAGAQELGLSLVIEDAPDKDALARMAADDTLLGLILIPPFSHDPVVLEELDAAGIRYMRVGSEMDSPGSITVGMDDRKASREITDYLIGLGHELIAYICGPEAHEVSLLRRLGYEDSMRASGLTISAQMIRAGDFSYASGVKAAEVLLNQDVQPTAIVCANDEMAAGCLAAAYRNNIRVPEKLSVAGFDDSPVARVIYPSLTTIHQATRDMAKRAVILLHKNSLDDAAPGDVERMTHELIIRESTGPVPQ